MQNQASSNAPALADVVRAVEDEAGWKPDLERIRMELRRDHKTEPDEAVLARIVLLCNRVQESLGIDKEDAEGLLSDTLTLCDGGSVLAPL